MTDKGKGRPVLAVITATPKPITGLPNLILYLSVDFKLLRTMQKEYRWPRPRRCPRCGGTRLWGHGYVDRFFEWEVEALAMKRWRCPDCGAVHTMRAATHWRGFWAPWPLIMSSLLAKASGVAWLASISRQRQQYWWRGYRLQSQVLGAPLGLWTLLLSGRIVSTHSLTYREIRAVCGTTHRIFAVTAPSGGP